MKLRVGSGTSLCCHAERDPNGLDGHVALVGHFQIIGLLGG
jgi:hypothetical protein